MTIKDFVYIWIIVCSAWVCAMLISFIMDNKNKKISTLEEELIKAQYTVNSLEACSLPDKAYTELSDKLDRCDSELEKRTTTSCGDYDCGEVVWFIGYWGVWSGRIVLYSNLNEVKKWEVGEYWVVEEKHYFSDDYYWPDWILAPSSLFPSKEALLLYVNGL